MPDNSLFTRGKDTSFVALSVYVDDIVVASPDLEIIQEVKRQINDNFQIKDLGTLKYFLSLEVARQVKDIAVCQRKYALELLDDTGFTNAKPVHSPTVPSHKLSKSEGKWQIFFGGARVPFSVGVAAVIFGSTATVHRKLFGGMGRRIMGGISEFLPGQHVSVSAQHICSGSSTSIPGDDYVPYVHTHSTWTAQMALAACDLSVVPRENIPARFVIHSSLGGENMTKLGSESRILMPLAQILLKSDVTIIGEIT
nr:uncharacterized protein LOC109166970 [Ipomoea batatas]